MERGAGRGEEKEVLMEGADKGRSQNPDAILPNGSLSGRRSDRNHLDHQPTDVRSLLLADIRQQRQSNQRRTIS